MHLTGRRPCSWSPPPPPRLCNQALQTGQLRKISSHRDPEPERQDSWFSQFVVLLGNSGFLSRCVVFRVEEAVVATERDERARLPGRCQVQV